MILSVIAAVLLSAAAGGAMAALFLLWPRRLTAEEWVLRRRSLATPAPGGAPPDPDTHRGAIFGRLGLAKLESLLRADLGILRLAHQPVPDDERFVSRLGVLAIAGAIGGLALLVLIVAVNRSVPSPIGLLLPAGGVLLLPMWSWFGVRRRAGQLREGIERHLPRSLIAARVLLESGAATPEGALTHVVTVYEDAAAEVIAEALRLKEVRRLPLEDALDEVAQRFDVGPLARLADSFRIGARYGTSMAELLANQSAQLRQQWFATYRERITRAPVTMTIPALIFFVTPLLVLILIMVFAPLVGWLGGL